MKHLKGSLLLILIVIIVCIFYKGDVKAGNGDFFKEYSGDYCEDDDYSFRLKYKCRLTIYIEGKVFLDDDDEYDDDEYDDVYVYNGNIFVSLDDDYYDDTVFKKYLDLPANCQKTITLEAGEYSLFVVSDGPYYISLSGEYYPELSSEDITLQEGKTKTLKVNGTSSKVNWSSSKKSVASVSSKGVVKAKKAGKAVITAKCGKYSLKCNVTVKKKPVSYRTISNKMKNFAKKNKNFQFKTVNVGKKCRLYAGQLADISSEEKIYSEGYSMIVTFQPYIELVNKKNKTELYLRVKGRLYEISLYSSTSLNCQKLNVATSNRRLTFDMKNTSRKNIYNYSKGWYEGEMNGYATIASSSQKSFSKLKKFATMVGQNSFSMKIVSWGGAYFQSSPSASGLNNWKKLVKEYQTLLKEY